MFLGNSGQQEHGLEVNKQIKHSCTRQKHLTHCWLARIMTLTLSWGCGKWAFSSPTGSPFLKFCTNIPKALFQLLNNVFGNEVFNKPLLSATETTPNIPTARMEETTAATLGFVCLVLDWSSFHAQDWGKNSVFLGEHFCLHYQKGCSKEMRKTFPLCPIKTPEHCSSKR